MIYISSVCGVPGFNAEMEPKKTCAPIERPIL
jgi:hypothetical protein